MEMVKLMEMIGIDEETIKDTCFRNFYNNFFYHYCETGELATYRSDLDPETHNIQEFGELKVDYEREMVICEKCKHEISKEMIYKAYKEAPVTVGEEEENA
jgi:hypothetical protein